MTPLPDNTCDECGHDLLQHERSQYNRCPECRQLGCQCHPGPFHGTGTTKAAPEGAAERVRVTPNIPPINFQAELRAELGHLTKDAHPEYVDAVVQGITAIILKAIGEDEPQDEKTEFMVNRAINNRNKLRAQLRAIVGGKE